MRWRNHGLTPPRLSSPWTEYSRHIGTTTSSWFSWVTRRPVDASARPAAWQCWQHLVPPNGGLARRAALCGEQMRLAPSSFWGHTGQDRKQKLRTQTVRLGDELGHTGKHTGQAWALTPVPAPGLLHVTVSKGSQTSRSKQDHRQQKCFGNSTVPSAKDATGTGPPQSLAASNAGSATASTRQ